MTFSNVDVTFIPVPEPSTLSLLWMGGIAATFIGWRVRVARPEDYRFSEANVQPGKIELASIAGIG